MDIAFEVGDQEDTVTRREQAPVPHGAGSNASRQGDLLRPGCGTSMFRTRIGGRKRTSELINHCTHILLSDSLSHSQRVRALSAVMHLAVALGHADQVVSVPDWAERTTPRTRSVSRAEAARFTTPLMTSLRACPRPGNTPPQPMIPAPAGCYAPASRAASSMSTNMSLDRQR